MSESIAKNSVVHMHYTLHDIEGNLIDESKETPLAYLHGHGNIIPGLEKELEGKSVGDEFKVTVEPKEAYGEFNKDLIQVVSMDMFEGQSNLQPGMQFQAQTEGGMILATITKVEGNDVTVDANHPLAGKSLVFEVKIEAIRDAKAEELEHGHVHGPGGHHHG